MGGKGKTALQKRLAHMKQAIVVTGKSADMKYGIHCYRENKKEYPRIVIINQPRSVEHIGWDGIESIKDGLFFSTKYECGMHVFNPPHLFIFSNQPPPLAKLSKDRWKVFELEGNEMIEWFGEDAGECLV